MYSQFFNILTELYLLYLKYLPDTLALDEPKLPILEFCLCWDITQKQKKNCDLHII